MYSIYESYRPPKNKSSSQFLAISANFLEELNEISKEIEDSKFINQEHKSIEAKLQSKIIDKVMKLRNTVLKNSNKNEKDAQS